MNRPSPARNVAPPGLFEAELLRPRGCRPAAGGLFSTGPAIHHDCDEQLAAVVDEVSEVRA
jgi:hypothetical protein